MGKAQSIRRIGFGAKLEYSTNDIAYRVTFVAPEGGGVLLSDKILYEAPAQGYQMEVSALFSDQNRAKRLPFAEQRFWLFIKSNEPTIYSMLDVVFDGTVSPANGIVPSIRFETVVNPYGERNFEEETELDYTVRKQLETEARISLRESKRPSKPDLPELIKEAKEKAEKDKGKQ